jgi:hypothetical protein
MKSKLLQFASKSGEPSSGCLFEAIQGLVEFTELCGIGRPPQSNAHEEMHYEYQFGV